MKRKIIYSIFFIAAIVGLGLIIAESKSSQTVRFSPVEQDIEQDIDEPFA